MQPLRVYCLCVAGLSFCFIATHTTTSTLILRLSSALNCGARWRLIKRRIDVHFTTLTHPVVHHSHLDCSGVYCGARWLPMKRRLDVLYNSYSP
jgi:hypothetical protein